MTKDQRTPKAHHGKNVKHFRTIRGLQEKEIAQMLGDEWTDQKIALLEAQEEIESNLLEKVAQILKVDFDYLKEFKEEHAITNIQNNYDNVSSPVNNSGPYGTINNDNTHLVEAVRKIQELADENKELLKESIKEKEETIAVMKKAMDMIEKYRAGQSK